MRNTRKKRGLALLLCAAVLAALLPTAAMAEGNAPFTVLDANNQAVAPDGDGQYVLTAENSPYAVSGTWSGELRNVDEDHYKSVLLVKSGETVSVTLDNTSIDVSGKEGGCAFAVEAGGTANVTLSGASTLKSGRYRAGLETPETATLTLTGGDGDSLDAQGGGDGAGIGGGGGRRSDDDGGSGGKITISGGTVTAKSTDGRGAGIGGGGGYDGGGGSGGDITIGGDAHVEAMNTGYGAGIGGGGGGGSGGSGGTISISGDAHVEAMNTGYGAGIGGGVGGGVGGSGGVIRIGENADVEATGYYGAGIGGSTRGSGGKITISGGTVIAKSTAGGAGIGGGDGGEGGTIEITGGAVTATSNGSGAGIGGGNQKAGGKTTITGGTVIAKSAGNGAGIGGGGEYSGGKSGGVIIIGGDAHVEATGGNGAGIGGGGGDRTKSMEGGGSDNDSGSGGTITIGGAAYVKATGGNGAGIGGGSCGQDGGKGGGSGKITVEGNAVVSANSSLPAPIGAGKDYDGGDGEVHKTQGVIFEGAAGKVYGSVTLPDDLTVEDGHPLTVPKGAALAVPEGKTLTNEGTITIEGTVTNQGTIENSGAVTGGGTIENNGTVYDYSNGITVNVTGAPVFKAWDGSDDKNVSGLGVQPGGGVLITGSNDGGGATLTVDVANVTVTSRGKAVSGVSIAVPGGIKALIVKDLDLTAQDKKFALSFGASDAALTVKGTCELTGGAGDSESWGVDAIYGNGNLTVAVGDASLTATGGAATASYRGGDGMYAYGALDVNVGNGGSLTAMGGDSAESGGRALAGRTSVKVQNDGTILAKGGKVGGKSDGTGIFSGGDLTLTGSGATNAQGAGGIDLGGVLTVDGTGTVMAEGTYAGIFFENGSGYRLAGDGTLTAAGVNGEEYSFGIFTTGDLDLAFTGSLTAHGGKSTWGGGIFVAGDLTVSKAPAALDLRPGEGTDGYALSYENLVNSTDIPDGVFVKGGTESVDWPACAVSYAAPDADDGSVPETVYRKADTDVTVPGNPGGLTRSGYVFAGWSIDGATPAIVYTAGQTFPMPGEDVTLTAQWSAAPIASGPSYTSRTLSDKESGVKVAGKKVYSTAKLTVEAGKLHDAGDAGCDLLRAAQISGRLLGAWDVSLSKTFKDTVTVSLPVAGRDGETLTVAHCVDGKLTLTDVSVSGGYAAVTADSLSPFAVLDGVYTLADLEKLAASIENPFTDVAVGDWFHDAAVYVNARGLMTGTAAGTFSPGEVVTRGQLAVILWRMEGSLDVVKETNFTDLLPGAWYADAAAWCGEQGLMEGYGDGLFGPGDPVAREQLAAVLYRYAQLKGWDVSAGEDTNILSYTDAFDMSEWAVPALQWACGAGVLQGDGGRLNPQGAATRAELAVMLLRLLEK